MTRPLEPITFPYLTTLNWVPCSPEYAFAATNNLSDVNLVAPYRLIGLDALSVDKATTRSTPLSMQASIKFIAPTTLVFTHSKGLYSAVGTILVAAACTTMSTPSNARYNRSLSRTSPRKTQHGFHFENLCHIPLFHLIS